MPEAWRIVKVKHVATAFSGEGAAKYGGRWNSRGVPVVYASATRSLAALETLVHLNPPVYFQYRIIRAEFADELTSTVSHLPRDWKSQPPSPSTKRLGDVWVRTARSAVLAVPSVIVAGELNYLLNPAHLDFKRIVIGKPERFGFDPRLVT